MAARKYHTSHHIQLYIAWTFFIEGVLNTSDTNMAADKKTLVYIGYKYIYT
jgi:hypothetical protein